MLFNSIDFALFLVIVFALFWALSKFGLKYQNVLLLIASYTFYGWWDWRFLILIFASTLVDYSIGLKLGSEERVTHRKLLLYSSILFNVGLLLFFKYCNFFIQTFVDAFTLFGIKQDIRLLNIILPVGISFYTFQTLSYTIDIYRRKFEPTNDLIAFSTFVSFFPQLVAGPIERAKNLLPQFYKKRTFSYNEAIDGMRQILWGMFKKVVIADNCAEFANHIFNNYQEMNGSTLFLGAIFFTFQIYGDFSGYSDIAIGVSRLFGIKLNQNFAFPYFSRDIAEFWRRWHISLSSWFKDYVYIPLGGSRTNQLRKVRNVFVIFLLSGFWHGANWTFIAWGAFNAICFLPYLRGNKNKKYIGVVAQQRTFPSLTELIEMSFTFNLIVFGWIFFRAENVQDSVLYISEIFSTSFFSIPRFPERIKALQLLIVIILFILVEWKGRQHQYAIQRFGAEKTKVFRYTFYYLLIFAIFWFGGKQQEFIYFQF